MLVSTITTLPLLELTVNLLFIHQKAQLGPKDFYTLGLV